MNNPSRWKPLDLLLLLVAGAAVSILGLSYFFPQRPEGTPTQLTRSEMMERVIGKSLSPLRTRGRNEAAWLNLDGPYLAGRYALVFVFGSDCHYCESTAAVWAELEAIFGADLHTVLLNGESPAVAEAWRQRMSEDLGALGDTLVVASSHLEIGQKWGLPGVPATLFLDPTGKVISAEFGALPSEMWEPFIASVRASLSPTGTIRSEEKKPK